MFALEEEHTRDPDVRESVRWCSLDSVKNACETPIRDDLARRRWDDLDDLEASRECAITEVEQPGVRSTLPEEPSYRCLLDYLGAYAVWDMPSGSLGPQPRDFEVVENSVQGSDELPVVDRENDPPLIDVVS